MSHAETLACLMCSFKHVVSLKCTFTYVSCAGFSLCNVQCSETDGSVYWQLVAEMKRRQDLKRRWAVGPANHVFEGGMG